MDKPKVVTLCGSTRFYTHFQEALYKETMAGKIVLTVGFYPHAQVQAHGQVVGCTDEQKVMLDNLHLRKIDMSDEILVLNVDGYVGESTTKEIKYAITMNKKVRWYDQEKLPVWCSSFALNHLIKLYKEG